MISPDEALRIALDAFPKGPETLIEKLGVIVKSRPFSGCDGYCVTRANRAIISLNENHSLIRRRFTLAHELAHLILGVPSVVGESLSDMLSSDSDDEKRVNAFAAELLIPRSIVEVHVREVPVVAAVLRRLAKSANVSELAAALRVANLATEIGLKNASVVYFEGDLVRWQWSRTLSMTEDTAQQLLQEARTAAPQAFRGDMGDGTFAVASILENERFGTTTLFVQLLPVLIANNVTTDERRRELEAKLFEGNGVLSRSMSGYIGALKNRISGKSPQEVEQDFWSRYSATLEATTINSEEGREYVRLRIGQWY